VRHAHHWLILHGRYVCVARKPRCPECPIRDLCEFKHKTAPEKAAAKPASLHPARQAHVVTRTRASGATAKPRGKESRTAK
jgi:adenine-specific DNA glycosylase